MIQSFENGSHTGILEQKYDIYLDFCLWMSLQKVPSDFKAKHKRNELLLAFERLQKHTKQETHNNDGDSMHLF